MGKVNEWLQEKLFPPTPASGLRAANSLPGTLTRDVLGDVTPLPVIIQAEDGASLAAIKSDLATIVPGASAPDTIFRFIRVVAPSGFVSAIAQIPGVRVVSYDAPVWIRQAPTMIDPLLGKISVSAIEIPDDPSRALASAPLRLALSPIALAANTLSAVTGSRWEGPKGDVIIVPTGETREWMGIPSDNRIATRVAVLDTGVTFPHVLLRPDNGIPDMFSTTGEPPLDGLGHGQWCVTAAFGQDMNTRFGRCAGVAAPRNNDIISVKCLSNIGFGTNWGVMQAMEKAWSEGAKVVNMSLGGPLQGSVDDDPQCQLIERLAGEMIFCVAAGNSGPDDWTIGSPGASPYALTVGAWSTHYDGLAIFSSRGPSGEFYEGHFDVWQEDTATYGENLTKPDCVAPGGGPVEEGQTPDMIYSGVTGWMDGMQDLTLGEGLDAMRGTSMATPHAAGLIAYAYDRGIVKTAQDVKDRLKVHAEKNKEVGYGFLSLDKLIDEEHEIPPTPTVAQIQTREREQSTVPLIQWRWN